MPEVRIVLDSGDRDRLRLPEVTSGCKGGFIANLCDRRGVGLCSSTIIDLFYPKTNKKKRVMLGKRVYQETVNYRIPPRELRSTGR